MPDLTGSWTGTIDVPGSALAFGVTFGEGSATFDLPAQGVRGFRVADLDVTEVEEDGARVGFALPQLPGGAAFRGTLVKGVIIGEYTQAGAVFRFMMQRGEPAQTVRPQDPQPPLPYAVEEVTVPAGAVTLAGTLTRPEGAGPHPAVVLVTGSGSHERDEPVAGHRPFLVLADALTRAGAAVLRLDDRGVGGSGGAKRECTYEELAADVRAAVAFLAARPEVDPARVGLLGHSQGGYLAPLAAGPDVAFVVMLAGPAVPGEDVLVAQNELLMAASGAPAEKIAAQVAYVHELAALLRAGDVDGARELTRARIAVQAPTLSAAEIEAMSPVAPVLGAFVTYDPAPSLRALTVPVLALYGELDLQVPAAQSEPVARALLAGNPDATVRTITGVNHLMQPATTGRVEEYASIPTTIAPEVLEAITGWVRTHVG